ncbi:kinase subunit of RNA polymerase II carboxy-terminal domain kinase I [Tulasnella sp. 331]|nr:kinase subunit of RNA polymerase II carboxy-terminal domain kinase I [Tulasnella sp. 331]
MYGGSRSLRDNRDRVYEEDLVGSTAQEDSYYRGGSHRDRVSSSSTHPVDSSSRSSRYRPEAEGGGGARTSSGRARSPYTGDDRWIPRDKLPSNTHANYSTASYSRSHTSDNGYASRRTSDDHYRSGGGRHEETTWSAASRGSRDDYRNTNSSAAVHDSAWDHSRRYPEANHTDNARHAYGTYPIGQGPSQPRRENGGPWMPVVDDGGVSNGRSVPDDRAWTRRGDDREWTKDDGRHLRDDPSARTSALKNGWEPPPVYPPEPAAEVVKAKFVPGPGWRPDLDEPSASRGAGSARHSSTSWKHNRGNDSRRKDKDHGNGRHSSKAYERGDRQRDVKKHNSRDEASSRNDRKTQKRRRSQSRSVSRSRSRSRSASIHSETRPLSPASSAKRRRKVSASPEDRQSERKSSHRTKKDRGGGSSPSHIEDEEDEARGRRNTSASRSRRRNDSRSRSVDSKVGAQKQGSTGTARSTTRKERLPLKSPSRSRSRSRSPSSSPQAALKTNGASKHRLPPSGPRAVDLMHVKIQPVSSTFMASSSRATVAAAYQRRSLVGEPPPGPRADLLQQPQIHTYPASSTTTTIPTGPKGVYPPPSASQQPNSIHTHTQSLTPSSASAGVPRGPKVSNTTLLTSQGVPAGPRNSVAFPMPVAIGSSALVKRFFPDDDEDQENQDENDALAQGGGSGFGVIPKRSKHPAGRTATPPPSSQSSRTRTVSPTAAARSPIFTKGSHPPISPIQTKSPVVVKGVYERPIKPRTPPSPSPPVVQRNERISERDQTPVDRARRPTLTATSQEASVPGTPIPASSSKTIPPLAELYQLVNQVGEGTFGKVYKARNVVTGALVALKRIKVEAEKDGFPVTALREIKLLQSLSHPNVIYLHEMMVSKGNVYMVFDYMEHDLTGVLSQNQFQFSPAHLKSLCHQMLRGLEYLHQRGVIHRDMKGSNILVNSRGELKLADFGLARVFQKRRKNDYTNRVITLWYRPPELLLGTTVYGPEVDMWSAGTIMLELFTKKPVFQGNDEIHQLEVIYRILGTATPEVWPSLTDMPWYELVKPKEIHKNYFRVAFQKYLPPDALDLAEGLLAYDTEKRLTATQALTMPYFVSEDPPMELPIGLSTVEGEWHELETKREREKTRKKKKTDGLPVNGNGIDHQAGSSGPADIPTG